MIRAIVSYANYTDGNLAPIAQAGHDGVAGHAATFATPMPALALFQTHITNLQHRTHRRADEPRTRYDAGEE